MKTKWFNKFDPNGHVIIFLDIDGVLVTAQSMHYHIHNGQDYDTFCPIACSNLRYLLKQYPAKVVISSSWRIHNSLADMREWLRESIPNIEVIDVTPRSGKGIRGHEIDLWLKRTDVPVKDIVIIDDDTDMVGLCRYLFRTKASVGLDHIKANRIVRYLQSTSKFYRIWVRMRNAARVVWINLRYRLLAKIMGPRYWRVFGN